MKINLKKYYGIELLICKLTLIFCVIAGRGLINKREYRRANKNTSHLAFSATPVKPSLELQ